MTNETKLHETMGLKENDLVVITFRNGVQLEGKINEFSISGEVAWIEATEVGTDYTDYYDIDLGDHGYKLTIEKVEAEAGEAGEAVEVNENGSKIVEDYVIRDFKEVKDDVLKAVKWADEAVIQVKVYEFDENDEAGYDVELVVTVDDETEWHGLNTYGHEKDALKRAKAVLKMVQGWMIVNKVDGDVTILDTIEQYHA